MRFETRLALLWEYALGAFKWLLALFMILEGFATMFSPVTPLDGRLGWLYSSRLTLIIFGFIFLASGLMLLWGKIRRSKKWVGHGLLAIYLCFLFATLIQFVARPNVVIEYLPNLIGSLVIGALWLRWKMKTKYINPKHFVRDVENFSD